jgi:hypothetical protein
MKDMGGGGFAVRGCVHTKMNRHIWTGTISFRENTYAKIPIDGAISFMHTNTYTIVD